jgi:hypothetical protein
MGFPTVMRIIAGEIAGSEILPQTLFQTLSDLNLLAVCLEETGNHYCLILDPGQHGNLEYALEEEHSCVYTV